MNIKHELSVIIILWLTFSGFYFIFQQINARNTIDEHLSQKSKQQLETIYRWIIFLAMYCRNFSCILTSFVFIQIMLKKKELNIDVDCKETVYDFDYVINSVIATNKFDQFMNEDQKAKVFLPMWHIFKTIRIIGIIKEEESDPVQQ